MITFVAQVHEGVGVSVLATLALGFSPLIIFLIAVFKNPVKAHLTRFTLGCAIFAMLGIVLWSVTSNAELAIIFSIIADISASLPTILKAYHDPATEYGIPYLVSAISLLIVLLTIHSWTFATYAFPVYMLAINVTLLAFAALPIKSALKTLRFSGRPREPALDSD